MKNDVSWTLWALLPSWSLSFVLNRLKYDYDHKYICIACMSMLLKWFKIFIMIYFIPALHAIGIWSVKQSSAKTCLLTRYPPHIYRLHITWLKNLCTFVLLLGMAMAYMMMSRLWTSWLPIMFTQPVVMKLLPGGQGKGRKMTWGKIVHFHYILHFHIPHPIYWFC